MTKIEIDKPVLPKWLDKIIKDKAIKNFVFDDDSTSTLFSEVQEEVYERYDSKTENTDYIENNEDKILSALIYGYAVED